MTVPSATSIYVEPDALSGQSAVPEGAVHLNEAREALRERFLELAALIDDWDAEGAHAVDRVALNVAWRLCEQALRAELPTPEVFPVANGALHLEWQAGPVELEVEILAGGSSAAFVCDDEQAGQEIDGVLPRDEPRFGLALARLRAYA